MIGQKLSGGSLSQGSELVLEIAEARLSEVSVDGSLLVYAENVVGHMSAPLTIHGLQYGEEGMQVEARLPNELAKRHMSSQVLGGAAGSGVSRAKEAVADDPCERLVYSSRCGRIHMSNVTVKNRGIDWSAKNNLYWKHQVGGRGIEVDWCIEGSSRSS